MSHEDGVLSMALSVIIRRGRETKALSPGTDQVVMQREGSHLQPG